ncbi:hypothetical protein SAMN05421841_1013 [Chryseobacterium wanjuense]|jgi:hypothetical protein|uniref:C1q domain-containing protein n=1 Tax=Chryseobacterium wanjuense TaxID=356305 RepID=A0A1I0P6N1_9FLAO|nr:hypothetical protein [Chryseobacterium wanjuense]SEW09738.1 hypothetical protein SAMN05421841_1013 [Chryseobacterium wanjuense]
MRKITLHFFCACIAGITIHGQVGVGTSNPHPSALLDLDASNKGLLLPRIALLSTTDIATIPNPAKGLMVYAVQNSGTGITAIQKDTLYKFDGTQWKALTTREKFISNEIPRIVAVGRKTTVETCVGVTNGVFNLNQRSSTLITAAGGFTAPQAGYYMFSVKIVQLMAPSPSQPFNVSPYIQAPNLATYSYLYRGSGVSAQPASVLGVIHLTQGQVTQGFKWFFGTNTCTAEGRIQGQEVTWEYLGNPL